MWCARHAGWQPPSLALLQVPMAAVWLLLMCASCCPLRSAPCTMVSYASHRILAHVATLGAGEAIRCTFPAGLNSDHFHSWAPPPQPDGKIGRTVEMQLHRRNGLVTALRARRVGAAHRLLRSTAARKATPPAASPGVAMHLWLVL